MCSIADPPVAQRPLCHVDSPLSDVFGEIPWSSGRAGTEQTQEQTWKPCEERARLCARFWPDVPEAAAAAGS